MSIKPWEPNFKPSTASVSSIAVWIRLNELPIEYYENQTLKQIGSTIGTVLRIDTHTAVEARGRYARLCVQLDVNKPLITSIQIGDFKQSVSYEGLQRLCFSCGRLGHRKEACPYTIRPVASPSDSPRSHGNERERMEEPQGLCGTDNSGNHQTDFAAGHKDNYGPWMVVARRKNGGKLLKGLDLTKNLADPNLQGPMSHHAYSATKLDQNRVGKRKAIVGQNSSGQVIRENSFCALVEPIKQATTKYKQPLDHDDELPRPFTSELFSPSP